MAEPFTLIRLLVDIGLHRRPESKIEARLNDHFSEWSTTISNYDDEEIALSFESITVRSRYSAKSVGGGIQKAELPSMHTEYEDERESPTLLERAIAAFRGQWIAEVRLDISSGDGDDIRPPGYNLATATVRSHLHEGVGRMVRVEETSDLQADKVELKILYDGSVGEFRQELSEAIELLQHFQETMEDRVMIQLIRLYHSGQYDDSSSPWPDEEIAMQLGEFVLDTPITPARLAFATANIKEEIEAELDSTNTGHVTD